MEYLSLIFEIWGFHYEIYEESSPGKRRRYFIGWLQKIRRNLEVGFSETSVTIYKTMDRNFNILHCICSVQIVTSVVFEWLCFLSSISCIATRRAETPLGVILHGRVSFTHDFCLLSRYMQHVVNLPDIHISDLHVREKVGVASLLMAHQMSIFNKLGIFFETSDICRFFLRCIKCMTFIHNLLLPGEW